MINFCLNSLRIKRGVSPNRFNMFRIKWNDFENNTYGNGAWVFQTYAEAKVWVDHMNLQYLGKIRHWVDQHQQQQSNSS